ncbi:ABC transporter substrate-binding protein [Acidihalobacter ferrooxydans]|uniref:Nitrate ABC transporter substrate-binding protein n=1 Tax=Acidihalobacter ferrooxydans TaxID=1765967 RepID=A0A1P8UGK1_9GAMM|nr:ABC transporter substrate-binding protein [Acidihalobacter ferrooxydans]APZ42962.1 nitrate ABC transporter substrate-binding protein [Acidihalobacter ferrooxydans]
MNIKRILTAVTAMLALATLAAAHAATPVSFCTNWFAEPSHGGFYEAKAEGLYAKAGLDATIKMGGPQVNGMQLLLAGQCTFLMADSIGTLKALHAGAPVVAVATTYQKDPQVIIAHAGVKSLADLKGKPIEVSAEGMNNYWPWLKRKFGFTDSQARPYTFTIAPFLHDKSLSQQGYVTSEPYMIEQAGEKPKVFLLADYGYPNYSEVIVARADYVKKHPQVVAAFVRASAQGWRDYLCNPKPANKLIVEANPKMTSGLLAYGWKTIRAHDLVTGGAAAKLGIGTMTAARWQAIDNFMVNDAHMLPADFDYKKGYTLKFVKNLHVMARSCPAA